LSSCFLISLSAGKTTPSPKLAEYEISMDTDPSAGSSADISITLFWNNEVYKATIEAPSGSGKYTFYAADTFMYNDYNTYPSPDKAKMLIQNNQNGDGAIFNSMKLTLEDGTFFGVRSFCGDPAVVGTEYSNFIVGNNQCDPGLTNYDAVCVDDTSSTKCNPSNLLINFNKRFPDKYIDNAYIENADGLFVEGCQLIVTPNVARKCARKDKNDCITADSCELVTKQVGVYLQTNNVFYDEAKTSKIFNVEWKNNQRIMPQNLLFLLIAISSFTNLFFCFCGQKKGISSKDYGSMQVTTPLLVQEDV